MLLNYFRNYLLIIMIYGFPLNSTRSHAVPIPSVWQVPIQNSYFVGRQSILQDIHSYLKDSPIKIAVIHGFSGFGKTQIAKQYVYNHYTAYDVVWWFKASQFLEPQFRYFAHELANYILIALDADFDKADPKRLANVVKNAIRKHRLKCLIIFDDAQDYEDIEPYTPFSHDNNVHIIVTTKNANFTEHGFSVESFTREESLLYIHRFLGDEIKTAQDRLAHHLSDCPSSLALAVDYIRQIPGTTIDSYIQHYSLITKMPTHLLSRAARRMGGSVDGYKSDMIIATQMSLEAIKQISFEAFQLITFLSVWHNDEISLTDLEKWVRERFFKTDIPQLIYIINQFSLLGITYSKNNGKTYLNMHELTQKIIGNLISKDEKRHFINEAVSILLEAFSSTSDQIFAKLMKDNRPLLHGFKISELATQINYHSQTLATLRVKMFDVLLCAFRNIEQAKTIKQHLDQDVENGIILERQVAIIYNIIMSVYTGLTEVNYIKAIDYGKKATHLLEKEDDLFEEKIRHIANLIQYYSLVGDLKHCERLVLQGNVLLPQSQSIAYNCLFIFATSMYLIDKGENQKAIDLIIFHKHWLNELDLYPSMRFYILNQLAEAYLKNNQIDECLKILKKSEKYALLFYPDRENTFFANLDLLRAEGILLKTHKSHKPESYIESSLAVFQKIFKVQDKHRGQATGHMLLGKIYSLEKKFDEARKHYLLSEQILDKILQNKQITDMSTLYTSLAFLGIDIKDEQLTNIYLKKQMDIFGVDHLNTKKIMIYLDKNELPLPF